jgi:nucleoid-associated protein YgaU
MAVTPVKVLLFLLGGTAAAGATAYVAGVFDPLFDRHPAVVDGSSPGLADQNVAELPPSAGQTPGPLDGDGGPAVDRPAGEAEAGGDDAPEAGQDIAALSPDAAPSPPVIAPSFDLVRVEPDGSIVIAGHAAPNANVEAVIGSRVIGTATAGSDGAFAIVLDEPLKPGDYQIVLRSRTADNVVATSIETAVVSIPETLDGQVLALVEEPGKPTEFITVPKPQAAPDGGEVAVDGVTDGSPRQDAAVQDQPAQTGPAAGTTAADVGDDAAGQQTAASETPNEDSPGDGAAAPAAGGDGAPTSPETATGTASAPAPAVDEPAPGHRLAVEAVEIEGRKIFIAGVADPRHLVRGYANDDFLGEAKASAAGRFLVEAERDLPVGDYIIRVDAIDSNGGKVLARAAVPFEREEGENVAAVAPPAGGATREPPSSDAAAPKGDRVAAEGDATTGEGASPQATAEPGADPAAPLAAPLVAVDEPRPANGGVVVQGAQPPAVEAQGGEDGSPATGVAALVDEAPPAVAGSGSAVIAAAPEKGVVQPSSPGAPEAGSNVALATAPDVADPAGPVETSPSSPDALSPKLQNVDGAVIIRRGDTLWRISRRVYGRGVRYSTIYLANQDQIQNPDHILPGQVFKVPEQTDEGEAADLTKMGEQAVDTPVRQ